MDDSANTARFRVNLHDDSRRKRRIRRIVLFLALIAGAPLALRLENAFPSALDSIMVVVWIACAVAIRRATGREGTPFVLLSLAMAVFSAVLAMVDARQG